MKALVLAAGASTRLYPLTLSTPKCLLSVDGKTILDYQIEALIAVGIEELVIVVGFEKDQIMEHLASKAYPLKITYLHNDGFRNNGPVLGSLFLAREYLEGSVLFFHSDVLFTMEALHALLDDTRDSVMLYREGAWDEEAGKIIVDRETERVRECGKHIPEDRATGEYLQIAKFGEEACGELRAVLDNRARTGRDGFTIDAFNDLVKNETVQIFGLPFTGFSMEIDTPEDYAAAQAAWKS